jgi:hypothetical protein
MKKYFIFGTDACEAYNEMSFKEFLKEFYSFFFETSIVVLEDNAKNLKVLDSFIKCEYQEITEKQYNALIEKTEELLQNEYS